MKQKICAFSIADPNNEKYLVKLRNSLRKFHTEEELPLIEITGDKLRLATSRDKDFFYRATPITANALFDKYDIVIKIDADSVITAPINEAWEGEFDVKVVLNSNPREFKKYPVSVWDVHPINGYVNCGFVSMKNKAFVGHWMRLCHSLKFYNYQMREQDLLNIMIQYGDYNSVLLDNGDGFWGLASKGYEPDMILRDGKIMLPKNDEWNKIDKIVRVYHEAGGNVPNKLNFATRFQPEVAKFLNDLTK